MRMTARVRKIEDRSVRSRLTIEPAEELTADSDYMHQFATEAEARAWLQGKAAEHEIEPAEVFWVSDTNHVDHLGSFGSR